MTKKTDQFLIILDKLTEISERTARTETEISNIKVDITEIKQQDIYQNKMLDEHIAGTITNRERLEVEIKNRQDLEGRVEILEIVPKALKGFKTIFVYLLGIAAAVIGFWKKSK